MSNQNARIIFEYTTDNAVEDGCLFNLSKQYEKYVKKLGIIANVYCSEYVYKNYIQIADCARKFLSESSNENEIVDIRAWDILFMSRLAMKKAFNEGCSYFKFSCVLNNRIADEIVAVVKYDGLNFYILKDLSDD